MVSTQFASSYPPDMGGPLSTHVPPPPPPPSLASPTANSKKRSSAPCPPPPPPSSNPSSQVEGGAKKAKLTNSPPPPPPPPPSNPPSALHQRQGLSNPSLKNAPPPPPPSVPPPSSLLSSSVSGSRSLPQGGIHRSNPTTSTLRPPPPPPPPTAPSSHLVENRKLVPPPPPPPPPSSTKSASSLVPSTPRTTLITLPKGRFNEAACRQGARICRDVTDYERVRQVGRGAYGEVFQARCKKTNKLVALKKLLMVSAERDGFPCYSIREINILNNMKSHKNIVNLIEIVTCGAKRGSSSSPGDEDESGNNSAIYMVFEYLEFDMEGLLIASKSDPNVKITPHHVRSWSYQLLEGLAFLHSNRIMHRDLKGGNILVGANNCVKIADFGLARPLSESPNKYTQNLITLGFRPPEIMMGMLKYSTSADMWSVGAIFAQLLLKRPLFPVFKGQTEIDHLHSIFKLCGTPKLDESAACLAANPEYRYDMWPAYQEDCPLWQSHAHVTPLPRTLQDEFEGNAHKNPTGVSRAGRNGISPHAIDLVEKMLHLDPRKRISASDALDHEFFFTEPVKAPEELPKFKIDSAHEMESRNKQQEIHDKLMAQQRLKASASGGGAAAHGNP